MANQSSAAVFFRALIMLICLVGIPLAAIFGTSLPQVVKAVLAGQDADQESDDPQHQSPSFLPTGPPTSSFGGSSSGGPSQGSRRILAIPGNTGPHLSGVVAADYRAPVDPAAVPAATALSPGVPVGVPPEFEPRPEPVPRLPYEQPALLEGAYPPPAEPTGRPYSQVVDESTRMQERLRRLGATYLLLEFEGSRQPGYRFFCRMAIGGSPNHARNFEARDASPLGAMRRVVQQVEAWRIERQ